jgi:ornithine decarboxylase
MYKEKYHFNVERYMDPQRFEQIKRFAENLPTPTLVIDLHLVEKKYAELTRSFPQAKIFYAVKANPMEEIVTLLHQMGSHFDIASRYELDLMLSLGVDPSRLSYGNTIKKRSDIEYFYNKGVRLFATDSENDLLSISCAET